jgi:hypothetical protein
LGVGETASVAAAINATMPPSATCIGLSIARTDTPAARLFLCGRRPVGYVRQAPKVLGGGYSLP